MTTRIMNKHIITLNTEEGIEVEAPSWQPSNLLRTFVEYLQKEQENHTQEQIGRVVVTSWVTNYSASLTLHASGPDKCQLVAECFHCLV